MPATTEHGPLPAAIPTRDATVEDTWTPTPGAADEYTELLLLFTDTRLGLQTYPGQLCVEVSVSPPLPSGSWVGTMCESTSPEITTWSSGPYVSLPVSSTYSISVRSNATGCIATPQTGVVQEVDSGRVFGRMVVEIDCRGATVPTPTTVLDVVTPTIGIEYPTPAPIATRDAAVEEYYAVRLLYEDVSSIPVLPYPLYAGDLCIQVTANPPLADTGVFVPLCAHVSPIELNWFSSDFVHLPIATTYTATILSNDTGCEVMLHPFAEVTWRGHPTGEFVASINCDLMETPVSTAPATMDPDPTVPTIPLPTGTMSATMTVAATATATATSTAIPTRTPSPDPDGITPEPTASSEVATASVTPTKDAGAFVVQLPNTGAGSDDARHWSPVMLTGILLVGLVASVTHVARRNGR